MRDITDYVRLCSTCQRYKSSNQPSSGILQTQAPHRRFETVAIDLFRTLPITARANRWILSAEDLAPGMLNSSPYKKRPPLHVHKFLSKSTSCAMDFPANLSLTTARNLYRKSCNTPPKDLESLIPVRHPESNPVERKHRDLKTILAIAVQQDHNTWDVCLPANRFAMNTSITQATGFSPSYLVFGSEPRTASSINYDIRSVSTTENVAHDIVNHFERLDEAFRCARDVLAMNQDKRNKVVEHSEKQLPTFNIGGKVL